MSLRSWGNGFAAAALLLTVGVAAAQAPAGSTQTYVILAISTFLAILAITLLRPRPGDESANHLNDLRTQVSVRDIAFLRIGAQLISLPQTIDRNSIALGPVGENWEAESEQKSEIRAQKLLSLGLLDRRGSEVETSPLGRALIGFDDLMRVKRNAKSEA